MLKKNQEPFRNRLRAEDGLSLLELITVVVILLIVGVIAIPIYVGQSDKAKAATTMVDARSLVLNAESALTNKPGGMGASFINATFNNYSGSGGNTVTLYPNCRIGVPATSMYVDGGEYVIRVYHNSVEASKNYVMYDSKKHAWFRGTTTAGGTALALETSLNLATNACENTQMTFIY